MQAIPWPRHCLPTASSCSDAASSITAGAASIAPDRRSRTRWCSCDAMDGRSRTRAQRWWNCSPDSKRSARIAGLRWLSMCAQSTRRFPRCCRRASTTRLSSGRRNCGWSTSTSSGAPPEWVLRPGKRIRTTMHSSTRIATCSWLAAVPPDCRRRWRPDAPVPASHWSMSARRSAVPCCGTGARSTACPLPNGPRARSLN